MNTNRDKIINKFDLSKTGAQFPVICIYDNPIDYPGKYVARLWDTQTPTNLVATADSLEELRKSKPPEMMIMQRHPEDDPKIVETWL